MNLVVYCKFKGFVPKSFPLQHTATVRLNQVLLSLLQLLVQFDELVMNSYMELYDLAISQPVSF